MPEWLMGADCKFAGYTYAGSNPARPKNLMLKFYINLKLVIFIAGVGFEPTTSRL